MTQQSRTKAASRAINGQIRSLQRERNATLAGRYIPWGVPWCAGPGSDYHAEPADPDASPICDGCATRECVHEDAGRIAERIRQLQESLAPAVQGALF